MASFQILSELKWLRRNSSKRFNSALESFGTDPSYEISRIYWWNFIRLQIKKTVYLLMISIDSRHSILFQLKSIALNQIKMKLIEQTHRTVKMKYSQHLRYVCTRRAFCVPEKYLKCSIFEASSQEFRILNLNLWSMTEKHFDEDNLEKWNDWNK